MKTIDEIQEEVQDVINNYHLVDERMKQLHTMNYKIVYTWVKGGTVGRLYNLKKKKLYRIQISSSEQKGNFYKAFCVEISKEKINNKVLINI